MAKTNKRKQKKFPPLLDIIFLGTMGFVFTGYGIGSLLNNKVSASGSYGRGVGWEADGIAAFGISLAILALGLTFLYYLIDRFK